MCKKFQMQFACTIFLLLLVQVHIGHGVHTANHKVSKHPLLLIVSFDGFRYDYMEKADTPALKMLQTEGVSVPYMTAQFPTKTFPNHHSIATGLYPDDHGVTDNVVFDPKYERILTGFRVEDEHEFWNFHPDVLPIWIRNEQAKDGRYSGCYMWAGSPIGYGEDGKLLPTHLIPKYNKSVPWEDRVESVISWLTDPEKPANLAFLYHHEPDSAGHSFGTDSPQLTEEIKKADTRVAYLVKKLKDANLYDITNLVVLSDHGMETVVTERTVNITQFVDPNLYDRYGATPVIQIQPKNDKDFDAVFNGFQNASKAHHFKVYKKSDPELSELHYGTNRRIMDIVLLAYIGYGFEDTRLKDGVDGVHGYDNREKNMRAFFVARGPAFKKGFKSLNPIENIDLFSLFSNILEIKTAPNNGSFSRVENLLVKSGDQTSRGWTIYSANLFLTTATLCILGLSQGI